MKIMEQDIFSDFYLKTFKDPGDNKQSPHK